VNSDEAKAFHAKARRDSEGAKKDQDATSRLLPSVFAFFLLPFAIMPLVAVIPEPNAPVELREVPSPDLENDSALLTFGRSPLKRAQIILWRREPAVQRLV